MDPLVAVWHNFNKRININESAVGERLLLARAIICSKTRYLTRSVHNMWPLHWSQRPAHLLGQVPEALDYFLCSPVACRHSYNYHCKKYVHLFSIFFTYIPVLFASLSLHHLCTPDRIFAHRPSLFIKTVYSHLNTPLQPPSFLYFYLFS